MTPLGAALYIILIALFGALSAIVTMIAFSTLIMHRLERGETAVPIVLLIIALVFWILTFMLVIAGRP